MYLLRMLNHCDKMNGNVERGYTGESLFIHNNDLRENGGRARACARILANTGINAYGIIRVCCAARFMFFDLVLCEII